MKKIKVLIVDDSALVRTSLKEVLSSDEDIEVIGTASDPYVAVNYLKKDLPDIITLDIEMPRLDGLSFLKKIMSQHPLPVIICSTLTTQGSESTIRALEYGAVDVIAKPKMGTKQFFDESKIKICDAVKAAAMVKVKKKNFAEFVVDQKLTADVILQKSNKVFDVHTDKVIVIGSSTGGTEAIKEILEKLPEDMPGIVIVQHMPEHFTKAFANRLNKSCRLFIKEAEDGEVITRGKVLIAPGNHHLLLKRNGKQYFAEIKEGPFVSRHRPSVDVLFRSAARYAGKNAIGIILTGMGDDGAKGMLEMKEAGAFTIAQNEETCVVFGMPHEAIKLNAVIKIMPLSSISGYLINNCE